MISDRQKELHKRSCRIAVEDPMPMVREWKQSGVGKTSFIGFCNANKPLSRNTLNRLEKYIMQREKDLGL